MTAFPTSLGSLSTSAAEEGELWVNELGDGGCGTGDSKVNRGELINSV